MATASPNAVAVGGVHDNEGYGGAGAGVSGDDLELERFGPSLDDVSGTFLASMKSVGTAMAMAFVGAYLHRRGFMENSGKRTLALISQQVTFPLFLFTKILYCNQDWSSKPCPDVTRSLEDVWVLLFWPAYVVLVGLFTGWIVAALAGTKGRGQIRSVLAACAFPNSTGLPITLLTVVHTNFPATSDLGRIDPTLFLSVYLLLYPVLQWGFGGWLLAPDGDDDEDDDDNDDDEEDDEDDANEDEEKDDLGKKKKLDGEEEKQQQQQQQQHPKALDPDEAGPLPSAAPGLRRRHHHHRRRSVSGAVTPRSLRHHVLNNKEVTAHFYSHRRFLTSTDEGLYVSDADLPSLVQRWLEEDEVHHRNVHIIPTPQHSPHPGDGGGGDDDYGMGGGIFIGGSSDEDDKNSNLASPPPPPPSTSSQQRQQQLLQRPPKTISVSEGTPLISSDYKQLQQQQQYQEPSQVAYAAVAAAAAAAAGVGGNGGGGAAGGGRKSSLASSSRLSRRSVASDATAASKYDTDSLWETIKNISERCLQPPVVGSLVGIFCAVTPLRGIFVDIRDRQAHAPLQWLFDGLYSVGLAAVPINMMILGCNLSASQQSMAKTRKTTTTTTAGGGTGAAAEAGGGGGGGLLPVKTTVGIIVGKMVLMPAIGILTGWVLKTWLWNIPKEIEGAFYLVLMIVFITPTANNVMVMVELSGANTKEGIAMCIALQYAVAPVLLSITMTVAIGVASGWS